MARATFTSKDITLETLLTSHEAGGLIQCNPSSINKWVKEDRIPCFRTPGGHRRIKVADFIVFLKEHKMPVPSELVNANTLASVVGKVRAKSKR